MALVPSARYVSASGPVHPQPFSSWNDYLGLATLITRASDRGSPHEGPGPTAAGPHRGGDPVAHPPTGAPEGRRGPPPEQ